MNKEYLYRMNQIAHIGGKLALDLISNSSPYLKDDNVLRNADNISFFQVNLPYYFARNSVEEAKKRCLYGYQKLPDNLKRIVVEFDCQDKELKSLLKAWIGNSGRVKQVG